MTYNSVLLKKLLDGELDKKALPKLESMLKKQFMKEKKAMLKAYDIHPVTEELIEAADDPTIISPTGIVPKGNLFAFLGFHDGDRPAENVREMLDDGTQIVNFSKVQHRNDTYTVQLRTQVPTLGEINRQNPLPWIDRGWVDAVENGILGLPMFIFGIFTGGSSRSGTGLEVKNKISDGSFTGVGNYLNKILRDYKAKLRSGNN